MSAVDCVLCDSAVKNMKISVKCYSGHRVDETPRSIQFGSLVVEVKEIQDQWIGPDHRYFKVIGDDHATYIIRQDLISYNWGLTYYMHAIDGPDK